MKYLITLSILLFSIHSYSWSVLHDAGEVKVWKSNAFKDVYLSQRFGGNTQDFLAFELESANMKKRSLVSLIGVSHWTVTDVKLDKKHETLVLKGTYLDSSEKLNHFIERHYRKDGKVIQLLVVSIMNQKELETALTSFLKKNN